MRPVSPTAPFIQSASKGEVTSDPKTSPNTALQQLAVEQEKKRHAEEKEAQWRNTCVHHTDQDREKVSLDCPVCVRNDCEQAEAENKKLREALELAVSALRNQTEYIYAIAEGDIEQAKLLASKMDKAENQKIANSIRVALSETKTSEESNVPQCPPVARI